VKGPKIVGTQVQVSLHPKTLARIEAWAKLGPAHLTQAEAIAAVIEAGLATIPKPASNAPPKGNRAGERALAELCNGSDCFRADDFVRAQGCGERTLENYAAMGLIEPVTIPGEKRCFRITETGRERTAWVARFLTARG